MKIRNKQAVAWVAAQNDDGSNAFGNIKIIVAALVVSKEFVASLKGGAA